MCGTSRRGCFEEVDKPTCRGGHNTTTFPPPVGKAFPLTHTTTTTTTKTRVYTNSIKLHTYYQSRGWSMMC